MIWLRRCVSVELEFEKPIWQDDFGKIANEWFCQKLSCHLFLDSAIIQHKPQSKNFKSNLQQIETTQRMKKNYIRCVVSICWEIKIQKFSNFCCAKA